MYVGTVIEVQKNYGFVVARVDRSVAPTEDLAISLNGKEVALHPEKQLGNQLSLTANGGSVSDSFIGEKIYVRR